MLQSRPVRSTTLVGRENPDIQGLRHKAPPPEVGPTCTTRTPVDSRALDSRTPPCSPTSRRKAMRVRFGACRFLSCGGSSASGPVYLPGTGKLGRRSPGGNALRCRRAATARSNASAGCLPALTCDPHRLQRGHGPSHDCGLLWCWVDEWRHFGDDSRFGERLWWW